MLKFLGSTIDVTGIFRDVSCRDDRCRASDSILVPGNCSVPLPTYLMDLKASIRDIPDFPKPGILFRDITTLLNDGEALQATIDRLATECAPLNPQYILGMESRGFIFGTALAYRLGLGFVPIRKPGKLPAAVHSVEYTLEYGNDRLEVHQDAIPAGSRVLIVDDLIATGGTAAAAATLVDRLNCDLVGFAFVIELTGLNGRQHLPQVPIVSLVEY
jgi:adenine phosphoribosyltransferase